MRELLNGERESILSYIPATPASHEGRSRRWTTFRIARLENSKCRKVLVVREVFEIPSRHVRIVPMFHGSQNWTTINFERKD